ncbi:MAG: (deoxy)nucleoside triphosphate pyrophosphohydrolase [Sphingomonas sp.]
MTGIMIVVAAALIDRDGRVLAQRRPEGKMMAGLWEFPGGKVEPGETPECALVRELDEELGITIDAALLQPAVFASEPLAGRHMLLLLYICRRWSGTPRALDAEELLWCLPGALHRLEMPPADRPLIRLLESVL